MPKLALEPSVTTTTTQQVKLSPALRKKLLTKLKTFASLKAQRDALDSAMKREKEVVEQIMDDVGESSLSIEGYKTTLVAPVRKKFNPKRFVSLGGSLDIYNKAVDETPTNPYVRISVPGEKEDEE